MIPNRGRGVCAWGGWSFQHGWKALPVPVVAPGDGVGDGLGYFRLPLAPAASCIPAAPPVAIPAAGAVDECTDGGVIGPSSGHSSPPSPRPPPTISSDSPRLYMSAVSMKVIPPPPPRPPLRRPLP